MLPLLLPLLGPATVCLTQPQGVEPGELELRAPYDKLTDNYRDFANFNVETVRGVVFAGDGAFYLVNTHGSLLVEHSDLDPEPEGLWPTLNQPVALQVFGDLVLVLGGASHALAVHDRHTGEILAVRMLPNEPGDMVLDETSGIVYISSQAENCIVALDVNDFTDIREVRRYEVPGEMPRFLHLDRRPGLRRLVAAPMLSGNNTVGQAGSRGLNIPLLFATGNVVNTSQLQNGGLPDEDLFVFDLVGTGTAAPIASGREAGTLMMAHGRNPVTGEYWALNVDLHNDIEGQRSEAELVGVFATNALTIYDPGALTGMRDMPSRIVDLDDIQPYVPGSQYDPARSVSFPYGLDFVPASAPYFAGWAAISSPTGDLVAILDPQGRRVGDIPLPEGSIPRSIVIDDGGVWLGVYCWGTNELRGYLWADLNHPPLVMSIGVDPTPEPVRKGREVFYDAHPSTDGRFTCATCHAGGGNDGLAWKLSGLDEDQKDLMVTQTLIGIQDTPGWHWREERSLEEFNAAFPGLLGHAGPLDESPGGDLENLVDFINSLQPHANHVQSRARALDDRRTTQRFRNGLVGSAVLGQRHFFDRPSGSEFSCGECHLAPNGTLGVQVPDADPDVCRVQNIGVAHLRQLNHRDQPMAPLVDPQIGSNPLFVPRGGYGLLHSGKVEDIFAFAEGFDDFTAQEQSDMAAFMHQFDQGIAPAAHFAYRMDQDNALVAEDFVRGLLLRQAARGWIDVVAIGYANIDGIDYDIRWVYRPSEDGSEGVFVPETNPAFGFSLQQFSWVAQQGYGTVVFLGLPPGAGERWALDPDGDGLTEQEEEVLGTLQTAIDTDGDGFPDGYEVLHGTDPLVTNGSVADDAAPIFRAGYPRLDHAAGGYAKFFVECDEDVRVRVEAAVAGGPVFSQAEQGFAKRHTIVLAGLDPSFKGGRTNEYTATVTATDRSGNESTGTVPFTTAPTCAPDSEVRIGELEWIETSVAGGDLTAAVRVQVLSNLDAPFRAPVEGLVVLAQLFRRSEPGAPWQRVSDLTSPLLRNDMEILTVPENGSSLIDDYNALPGPYLLSPETGPDGRTQIDFSYPGVFTVPGRVLEVRLSIQGVFTKAPEHTPSDPVFTRESIPAWNMPATPAELRAIDLSF